MVIIFPTCIGTADAWILSTGTSYTITVSDAYGTFDSMLPFGSNTTVDSQLKPVEWNVTLPSVIGDDVPFWITVYSNAYRIEVWAPVPADAGWKWQMKNTNFNRESMMLSLASVIGFNSSPISFDASGVLETRFDSGYDIAGYPFLLPLEGDQWNVTIYVILRGTGDAMYLQQTEEYVNHETVNGLDEAIAYYDAYGILPGIYPEEFIFKDACIIPLNITIVENSSFFMERQETGNVRSLINGSVCHQHVIDYREDSIITASVSSPMNITMEISTAFYDMTSGYSKEFGGMQVADGKTTMRLESGSCFGGSRDIPIHGIVHLSFLTDGEQSFPSHHDLEYPSWLLSNERYQSGEYGFQDDSRKLVSYHSFHMSFVASGIMEGYEKDHETTGTYAFTLEESINSGVDDGLMDFIYSIKRKEGAIAGDVDRIFMDGEPAFNYFSPPLHEESGGRYITLTTLPSREDSTATTGNIMFSNFQVTLDDRASELDAFLTASTNDEFISQVASYALINFWVPKMFMLPSHVAVSSSYRSMLYSIFDDIENRNNGRVAFGQFIPSIVQSSDFILSLKYPATFHDGNGNPFVVTLDVMWSNETQFLESISYDVVFINTRTIRTMKMDVIDGENSLHDSVNWIIWVLIIISGGVAVIAYIRKRKSSRLDVGRLSSINCDDDLMCNDDFI